jgi:glycosyltransferase involved in cell wall biosynthesis
MEFETGPDAANTLVVIPAYNEAECIGSLVGDVHEALPGYRVLVVSDGSMDDTASVARKAGAVVLELPCNLGVGGAVQAGFRYAVEHGFTFVGRCDGDGQHPPEELKHLLEHMSATGADMVIGSRFLDTRSYRSTWFRSMGIRGLAALLSCSCRKRVTDPTSGFQVIRMPLLRVFALGYPAEYPEPEALALMRRQGYRFEELGVKFCERKTGQSSIRAWGTFYYIIKVFLALLVDRARPVDPRFSKANLVGVAEEGEAA